MSDEELSRVAQHFNCVDARTARDYATHADNPEEVGFGVLLTPEREAWGWEDDDDSYGEFLTAARFGEGTLQLDPLDAKATNTRALFSVKLSGVPSRLLQLICVLRFGLRY